MDNTIINARVKQSYLGRTVENIPYIAFTFTYSDNGLKQIDTNPILLLNPNQENLQQSGVAAALITIFNIFETSLWNDINGQVVKIEIKDNKVIKIINAIDDSKSIIIDNSTESEENSEVVDAEIVKE